MGFNKAANSLCRRTPQVSFPSADNSTSGWTIGSVPVLITATEVLTNSAAILRWVDRKASEQDKIYPTDPESLRRAEELVEQFDSVLGPAVRQWCYFYILDRP